jgi:hypothetical protein
VTTPPIIGLLKTGGKSMGAFHISRDRAEPAGAISGRA